MKQVEAGPAANTPEGQTNRLVVYALASTGAAVDEAVRIALRGLRSQARRLVVVVATNIAPSGLEELSSVADDVVVGPGNRFMPEFYRTALERESSGQWDEILLTGDSWFGPVGDFDDVFERMERSEATHWSMVENRHGLVRDFARQGFPRQSWPWVWMLVRRPVIASSAWTDYWRAPLDSTNVASSERLFADRLTAAGLKGAYAYESSAFPNENPAVFSPELLLDAGCPIVGREVFGLYPPFLQQHAIICRDVLRAVERHGYPLDAAWPMFARTVPPKALNTNAAMLEILPGAALGEMPTLRIVVVAYISDIALGRDLQDRLRSLPSGYDLIITTNDGVKARALRALWADAADGGPREVEVRVTPVNPGRDMSDFFVACRDVILGDRYDLILKVHARRKRAKTVNLRHYFRRYQWDNLLESREYVQALIALFDREPGLGLVFPPMMHIGYSTMGRGWGPYRDEATALLRRLGIQVPQDVVSPLAPYGGMWLARPAALRSLARQGWVYRDFRGPRPRQLARVLERIVVSAAAHDGFHARTALTREHAAISHTAIEFKIDEMMSTTSGYPADQIELMHRAGHTGRGGIVGLSRMYLRLNHPRVARVVLPPMAIAERVFLRTQRVRHTAGTAIRERRQRLGREGLR